MLSVFFQLVERVNYMDMQGKLWNTLRYMNEYSCDIKNCSIKYLSIYIRNIYKIHQCYL